MSVDRDLRNAAFNHLQTLSFSYFNRNSVGYIHARVMSDSGKIGEMVAAKLSAQVDEIKIIDKDRQRCLELSEKLPDNISIACGDGRN